MLRLSHLFTYPEPSQEWKNTKSAIEDGIDAAMEKGSCNKDTLRIMKDLLQDININTSMTDYVDEVNDG